MNARHRIPDDPIPGTAHYRATALVQALTGVRVDDSHPTRHDGSQSTARNADEVDQ